MSRTWNATFEAEPAGGDQGSTLDNKTRETRSEIRKRMDTIVSNWDSDPDTPTSLDLEDDVVLAEHVSGLVSTGAVDIDNIPEGTDKGAVFTFDGNAEAPADDYNDSGDGIVRVKEAITFLPISGTIEVGGVAYAYTSVTVADKEFNLSGTLSAALTEDDAVYVATTIRSLYVTGKLLTMGTETRYFSIAPAATGHGSGAYVDMASGISYFTPVFLPNGAVVTELYAWGANLTGAETLTINLMRCGWAADSGTSMAQVPLSAGTSSDNDTSIANAAIDNITYKYFLEITAGGGGTARWRGGRVKYTITRPLP